MSIPSEIDVQMSGALVKWKNWEPHRTDPDYGGHPYAHFNEYPEGLMLTRADILDHFGCSIRKGIISAIKWGYPRGQTPAGTWMGFSAAFRSDDLVRSIHALQTSPARPASHGLRLLNRSVVGIGTATTTKLAYFAGLTSVEGPCLIYDSMVRRAIRARSDQEFATLKQIISQSDRDLAPAQCQATYGHYLHAAHTMAKRLGVQGDQIELFLFSGRENAAASPPYL